MLGNQVSEDENAAARINYEKEVVKVENITKRWKNRNISLFGCILIVNSLIASLFVYKMGVLPPPIPKDILSKIQRLIESYLWQGAKPKITTTKLQLSKNSGGAKLVDLCKKDISIKVSWKRQLDSDPNHADLVYNMIQPILREDIWKCDLAIEGCGTTCKQN